MITGVLWLAENWRKLAITLLIVAIPASYAAGKLSGRHAAKSECDKKAEVAKLAQAITVSKAVASNEEREDAIREEFSNKVANAVAVDTARVGDIASGRERVRVRLVKCAPAQASSGQSAKTGDGADEGRRQGAYEPIAEGEIPKEDATEFYAIASERDECVRRLTYAQEYIKAAIIMVNGKKE